MVEARISSLERRFYPETQFGGFTGVDGTIAFYARVQELIPTDGVVVDCGCGRGAHHEDPVRIRRLLRTFKPPARRVIGLDIDAGARGNPYIDDFILIEPNGAWPMPAATADLVVADWVLEHVADPGHFFSEVMRVLRPGGVLCLRTTNVRSLVGCASSIIPNRKHARVLKSIGHERGEEDIFPTLYRCNTVSKLSRALQAAGFGPKLVYGYEAEPRYHNFSRIAYYLGVLHQRIAPRRIRSVLFAFATKPA